MNKKYCIVSGIAGFNDFFNAFFRACEKVEYGIDQNIDIGIIIHWMGMSDEFWDFFEPTDKIKKITNANEILQSIGQLKPFLFAQYVYHKNHIGMNRYINPEKINWQDNWDFMVEYFPGQWNYASCFFKYLRLTDFFRNHIKSIISILDNGNYICLNFRMQEYIRTLFGDRAEQFYEKKFIEYSENIIKIANENNSKILLCTDDVHLVKKFVDNKNIFSFGYAKHLVDSGMDLSKVDKNRGIHMDYHGVLGLSKRDICLYGFTDYILMSLSKILYPAEFGHFGKGAFNLKTYLDSNETTKAGIY